MKTTPDTWNYLTLCPLICDNIWNFAKCFLSVKIEEGGSFNINFFDIILIFELPLTFLTKTGHFWCQKLG